MDYTLIPCRCMEFAEYAIPPNILKKTLPDVISLKYLVYVSPAVDPTAASIPLVLFLHGATSRGHDLEKG